MEYNRWYFRILSSFHPSPIYTSTSWCILSWTQTWRSYWCGWSICDTIDVSSEITTRTFDMPCIPLRRADTLYRRC